MWFRQKLHLYVFSVPADESQRLPDFAIASLCLGTSSPRPKVEIAEALFPNFPVNELYASQICIW